jgi:lariat debranching enzyme
LATLRSGDVTDPIRVLVVGDIHGEFGLLARWSAAVRAVCGPLDAILAVGDVQANRNEADAAGVRSPAKYRKVGEFPLVVEGLLNLGAPLYFIGGNHEPWPALDAVGAGPWGGGAHFLGRAGVADVLGLRVAYLSGIYSPKITDSQSSRRDTNKDRTYYLAEEVEVVTRTVRRIGPADLLLTHDWPAGIADPYRGSPVGRPELRTLCEHVQPRWHFCGHLHHRHRAAIGTTEVVCLAHIRSGQKAFVLIERGSDGRLTLVEDPAQGADVGSVAAA